MTRTLEQANLGTQAYELFNNNRDVFEDYSHIEPLEVEFPYLTTDLARKFGAHSLYLFRADDNETGTFKLRGALMGAHVIQQMGFETFRAASAGNHARGVASAARALDFTSVDIGVPKLSPYEKREGLYELWDSSHIELHLVEGAFKETLAYMSKLKDRGPLLPAFDDPNVIAGQGTVVFDIIKQLPEVQRIVAPFGGGGLVAGMLQQLEALGRHDVTVHAVQAEKNNGLGLSFSAGKVTTTPHVDPYFAGSAVNTIGQLPFEVCQAAGNRLEVTSVTNKAVEALIGQYQQSRRDLCREEIQPYEPTTLVAIEGLRAIAKAHPQDTTVVIGTGHNSPLPKYI